jgi:hypothetical protein
LKTCRDAFGTFSNLPPQAIRIRPTAFTLAA